MKAVRIPKERVGALIGKDGASKKMLQERMQMTIRVDTEGETALVFIGGRCTHALHKGPMIRRGAGPLEHLMDNLVVTDATATAAQLDVAAQALAAAEDLLGPTTYARVDLVGSVERGPAVLELELLDPVFFFTHHPDGAAAAEALAGELARVLRASRSSQA